MRRSASRRRGVLITLEGIEGSGKTTQLGRLARWLRGEGYRVVVTREPGGTPVAEKLRSVLLQTARERITPECEALLICASRSQHVAHVIRPALQKGAIVLCDRFSDSTMAYQGYARGLHLARLRALDRLATEGLRPDLTLLFDVPVSKGLRRRARERKSQNRLDREHRRFHRRVRSGYLDLAARHPGRIKVIDGRAKPEAVAARVSAIVGSHLRRQPASHRLKRR